MSQLTQEEAKDREKFLELLRGINRQIRQQEKAIRRKNRLIHRLRTDNPHLRSWCWQYWGEQKNPWVQNEGGFPKGMPPFAKIDIVRSNGTKATGLSVAYLNWDMIGGLHPYIVKWRFHNSKEKPE